MASLDVMTAVNTLLAANWTHTPIVYPNEQSSVPSDGSAFLVVEYPVASEDQAAIGPAGVRLFRETGAIVLTLCAPTGLGINPVASPYAAWLDALRIVFRGISSPPLQTLAVDPIHFDEASERGAYCEMSISIAYYADFAL